jgi:hypothetical protein
MRADMIVTIIVGLLLSGVFAWAMCAAGGDADKQSEINYKTKELKDAKKEQDHDFPTDGGTN